MAQSPEVVELQPVPNVVKYEISRILTDSSWNPIHAISFDQQTSTNVYMLSTMNEIMYCDFTKNDGLCTRKEPCKLQLISYLIKLFLKRIKES